MADIFTFETSELEILETIDFEEEVQRPFSLRFFTLSDQLVDFFEKSLPPGKPTSFEKKQLQYMQQRLKTTYMENINFSETEYVLNSNRKEVNVSWIHEVYSGFDYEPYSLTKNYIPLLDKKNKLTPNYYPRLLTALPLPYKTTEEGRQLTKTSVLVNKDGKKPIIGLGNYMKTKTIINDDGSYGTEKEPVPYTTDDLKISGFFLDKKPFDLPNPMQDHPFLKSTASDYIESDIPLLSMYPSIQAIAEHAIPTTSDPYGEGSKYLKFYDIKLKDIPWGVWKQKFPSVETKEISKNVQPLSFPNKEIDEPSGVLVKTYSTPRYSAEHPRLWLAKQVDAGYLVPVLLLSASSTNGVISNPPSVQPPEPEYPISQSDICGNLLNDFDSFLSAGLYRPRRFENKTGIPLEGICVPVEKIQQEKQSHSSKKIRWNEAEEQAIKSRYVKLLSLFQIKTENEEKPKFEKMKIKEESERRKDILNILNDSERSDDDKVSTIELLLRDTDLINNIYMDKDSLFVICMHTLEILRGKLEENSFTFFNEWTTVNEGSRICKYCSEEVSSQVLVDTDDYDDDGYRVISSGKFEETVEYKSVPNNFFQIKNLFDLKHGGESLLFLTLSILQTLPQETQILPVLHLMRRITQSLNAKNASKRDKDRIEGILGICGIVIILQTHIPFLVPKRTIKLSGFPRDSDSPGDSEILDSILFLLKKTFSEFPVMLEGSISVIAGYIMSKLQKIKEETGKYLQVFAKEFRPLLENARERYSLPEIELSNINSVKFPIVRVEKPLFNVADVIGTEMGLVCDQKHLLTTWSSKISPSVQQPKIKYEKMDQARDLFAISTNVEEVKLLTLTKKEIQANISKGLPSAFSKLSEFVKTENDGCAFVTLTLRLLDLVKNTKFSKEKQIELRSQLVLLNSMEQSSLLRDAAKGYLFMFLNEVKESPEVVRIINEKLKSDLTLRILFTSKKSAEDEKFKLESQERNLFKARNREMTDTQREVVKMLVDIGQSEFIVSNIDRELFAKQYELEKLEMELDGNMPEEGYYDYRDYVENGDLPVAPDGALLEVDRGFYGDRAVRDYEDYGTSQTMDET